MWRGKEWVCSEIHKGLRGQWTYTIVDLNPQYAVLEAPDGTRTERLSHAKVASMFRLSFARTFHAAQGLEWPLVRLCDAESLSFTKQPLVVGLRRLLDSANLYIM